MSTETPEAKEAKELALVGKVELRIALTDTDTKLESILKTYLAPLLLKLGSEFLSVRKKVCYLTTDILSKLRCLLLPNHEFWLKLMHMKYAFRTENLQTRN